MKIHAIICTRSRDDISATTDRLINFLCRCEIGVYLVAGAKSLFSAYKGAYNKIAPGKDDIIIFCHDDIEIREKPEVFTKKLKELLNEPQVGFVGPAGTQRLGVDAVWWNMEHWQQGYHKGKVLHVDPQGKEYETVYGPPSDVVVLDGLFLAAKPKVIEDVGLEKPDYFTGDWDFYDIHYTASAFLKGYTNKVIDLNILHNSRGELVGRDSWHLNREAFIANTELPLKLYY
jgi:hypothetical protein|tara:strand:+ start:6117 stop:6809 length:693 start_codon:yes stop_codon:yes gene_type:complete